jgi:HSP20 family molecular chaperone IbpA
MTAVTTVRTRVAPEICSSTDDDLGVLSIEIQIPGVRKEDIVLKVRDDGLSLLAPRDDFDFSTTLAFCCPVNPDGVEAHYESGLLRISAPFRDVMEDAREVNIA